MLSFCNINYTKQDNVHTNTESVQCISIVYSICPYKYKWPFRPVEKIKNIFKYWYKHQWKASVKTTYGSWETVL